jgi:hypothetical protein
MADRAVSANLELHRRAQRDDELLLRILDVVDTDATVTQRSVARELGIALGLANTYVKRCIRKGFIKVAQVPSRRYAYYLTPQGFAEKSRLTASYLSHSLAFFRRARGHCADAFSEAQARGQRRVALIGEGDLAEIADIVAHDFPVTIVGVLPAEKTAEALAARAALLDRVDGFVITALLQSRETYLAAVAAFGAERVHVPALLRVRQPSIEEPESR